MPELPEVETICRQLKTKAEGKRITSVEILKQNVIKDILPADFKKNILGRRIDKVSRAAKVLIFKFDSAFFLVVHLRIAGWLIYGSREDKARVIFGLSDGKFLNYMDQRLLGEVRLVDDYRNLSFIKRLGPEALDIGFGEFKTLVKDKKTNIKSLLMDQEKISGLGNIYAQEALFLSGIDPRRKAQSLKDEETKKLYAKILEVLNEGIKYKGSSVDSYRDLGGEKGGMEIRLKVYGREGKPCKKCGNKIEKISLGGRGTCFCPACQK